MIKVISSFFILIFGSSAIACPNLSGKWSCDNGTNTWNIKVTEVVASSGHVAYEFDEGFRIKTYVVDSQWIRVKSEGDELAFKSYCEEANLIILRHNEYHTGEIVDGKTKNYVDRRGRWVADSESNGYPPSHTICTYETPAEPIAK